MKIYARYLPLTILILVLGAIWAAAPVLADDESLQEGTDSIQITMPAGAGVFMQHQAIVLRCDLSNPSSRPFHIDTTAPDMDGALGSGAWVQCSLLDVRGHSVPIQDDAHGLSKGGFGATYAQRIDPGGSFSQTIVASLWFKTPKIGRYTLVLVADQDVFRFPVTIVADDHAKLKAMAKQLGEEALEADNNTARRPLIQAVCVVPAADALLIWQQLSDAPRCRGIIAREIARTPSDVAADLLVKSVWSGDLAEEFHNGRLLDTMYNEGNPELRAHIKALYAQHGVAHLPDKLVLTADDN